MNGLVGHHVGKPALADSRQDVPVCLHSLSQLIVHALTYVVDLLERAKGQGNTIDLQVGVDIGEAAAGESASLQLAGPHLAQDAAVVAHHASRIELEGNAPLGFVLDEFGGFPELLHPIGTLRDHGGDFESRGGDRCACVQDKRQQTDEDEPISC